MIRNLIALSLFLFSTSASGAEDYLVNNFQIHYVCASSYSDGWDGDTQFVQGVLNVQRNVDEVDEVVFGPHNIHKLTYFLRADGSLFLVLSSSDYSVQVNGPIDSAVDRQYYNVVTTAPFELVVEYRSTPVTWPLLGTISDEYAKCNLTPN